DDPNSTSCHDVFKALRNPYYNGDQVGLTQTSGWFDGWTLTPSVYAVAARQTTDVVAAVNFAREYKLRLVIKGGGHSYQGTSHAAALAPFSKRYGLAAAGLLEAEIVTADGAVRIANACTSADL